MTLLVAMSVSSAWWWLSIHTVWLALLPVAVGVVVAWRLRRRAARRAREGCCVECGYDLRGTAAEAPCPECGVRQQR